MHTPGQRCIHLPVCSRQRPRVPTCKIAMHTHRPPSHHCAHSPLGCHSHRIRESLSNATHHSSKGRSTMATSGMRMPSTCRSCNSRWTVPLQDRKLLGPHYASHTSKATRNRGNTTHPSIMHQHLRYVQYHGDHPPREGAPWPSEDLRRPIRPSHHTPDRQMTNIRPRGGGRARSLYATPPRPPPRPPPPGFER